MTTPAAAPAPNHVKETLISILIAFVLAFVFRQFVIEAFIIPTGSMAPTLMGAHIRITSANSGQVWPVGPPYSSSPPPGSLGGGTPLPVQGTASNPVVVHDPMSGAPGTGERLQRTNVQTRSGDRILVLKYLYSIYDPKRFDVVVFKAPHEPQVNYIKRLVGLPGEEAAIIDGDMFTRKPAPGEASKPNEDAWALPGWQIQRKPERAQRSMWQDVFSSEYQPINPAVTGQSGRPFKSPWIGGDGWEIEGRESYEYTWKGATSLAWDVRNWLITDWYPYNEPSPSQPSPAMNLFPVSDVLMRCGVEPLEGPIAVSAVVRTRGHDFRVDIQGTAVTLKMGPVGPDGADGRRAAASNWTTLGSGTLGKALDKGRITNIEVWHVDQTLQLWVDGKRVALGEYNWSPAERTRHTFGMSTQELASRWADRSDNPLARPTSYPNPELKWEFGGPVRVHRVGVKRDIHYLAGVRNATPARATHPLTAMRLGPDHFFVCGDNSPQSLDARLWGEADPWVAATIDGTPGIVPRKLMIGRAFFVYFPSLIKGEGGAGLPVPDFGRLRWIF